MTTYHTLITNNGKAQIANAINTNTKVAITHLAVGDGRGTTPTPSAGATRLTGEKARVAVNHVGRHATKANWIEVHAIIPSSTGGFTVREIGLYAGKTLIAVGSFPATYKPSATEGSAREISIKLIIAVENASVVNVTLDDSLVYATRKWTQDNFVNHNEVIDNLTSTETTKPLSAAQGKKLQDDKLGKTENAVSATKLATARTINGVAFDGTQNITINDNTKAPAVHRHNWSEIDGKPAIITHPTQITSGDLDDYKEIGVYYCHTNVHARDIANTPSNLAFALEVVRAAGVVQIFREYETAIVYMRAFYRKWSPWKRLATTEDNAPTATKLATARTLALTGDGTGQANFDGSANANIALTLANSGVTAGSYNSVTVDAKGRVTAGLTQTHGLVTATTAQGTSNVATTNNNTFLNIVASGVGRTASVGSSTQITGTNGITVSSDTAGKLIVTRDSNSPTATKLATARTINGVAFDGTQNITINDNTKAPAVHRHNWSEIDGKPAIITHPTQITSGDLDDYKEIGVYYCHTNVHARDIANTPSNLAFALEVVRAAGVVQIFREYETAIVYMRAFYRKWSPWKRLATTEDNAPTATKLATARTLALTGAVTGSVNFDGSGNVSLATALKGIDRREYTGTLTPSHNSFKSQKVPMTGSVEVLPDGRMVQYFNFECPIIYFHRHNQRSFYREKLNGDYFNANEDKPLLELPLWTPMPSKVQEARIHLSTGGNHYSYGEAMEWIYDWDSIFNQKANIKDKAYFAFRRHYGNNDEAVTFTIVVEGY